MGLGKSLQSICIIGSKHHERAERHQLTGSVDSAHLPSLIVCPPTLCGHWYHEILKFTDYLRPVQYTGTSAQRAALRSKVKSPTTDIIITSYETIRADIDFFSTINWLYCVLDEGHIIKNPKTKLSAAIKQLKAQHRLLLSGTPIQNNVLELWSLFDFLMPGFLGNERVFNDRFSKPILADRDGKATPKERELGKLSQQIGKDHRLMNSNGGSGSTTQTSPALPPPTTERRRPARSTAKDHPRLPLRIIRYPKTAI
jgi:TATA-binding protein-associated factor